MSNRHPAYEPVRSSEGIQLPVRGINYQLRCWGELEGSAPPLVMLHGWMDVGASFQFLVDALASQGATQRTIVAPDWRGFGGSRGGSADSYWFPDYLGDLDALLMALSPAQPVDLLGHSMGANVAMLYAGVRPSRVRQLVALEGFGMPATQPAEAPARYARWLSDLARPMRLKPYASLEAVAARLHQNNPRLRADRAHWLAGQWAEQHEDGGWHLRADPAHKRVNPVLYREEEATACWRAIEAPTLWVEGAQTDILRSHPGAEARQHFDARLAQVPKLQRVRINDCGHMLHHDQPEALAAHMEAFLHPA